MAKHFGNTERIENLLASIQAGDAISRVRPSQHIGVTVGVSRAMPDVSRNPLLPPHSNKRAPTRKRLTDMIVRETDQFL